MEILWLSTVNEATPLSSFRTTIYTRYNDIQLFDVLVDIGPKIILILGDFRMNLWSTGQIGLRGIKW